LSRTWARNVPASGTGSASSLSSGWPVTAYSSTAIALLLLSDGPSDLFTP
jgi:hypothetical protein